MLHGDESEISWLENAYWSCFETSDYHKSSFWKAHPSVRYPYVQNTSILWLIVYKHAWTIELQSIVLYKDHMNIMVYGDCAVIELS